MTKRTWGAFATTELAGAAQGARRDAGGHRGCGHRHAASRRPRARPTRLGFNVTLAIDAMTDTRAEAHDYCLKHVFPRLGETGTSAEIIDLLRQGTPDMSWPPLLSYFFGGAFLANAVPHVVSGMMGGRSRARSPSRRARVFRRRPSTCSGASSTSSSATCWFAGSATSICGMPGHVSPSGSALSAERCIWPGISAASTAATRRSVDERRRAGASSGRCGAIITGSGRRAPWSPTSAPGCSARPRTGWCSPNSPITTPRPSAWSWRCSSGRNSCCCPGPASPPIISTSASS